MKIVTVVFSLMSIALLVSCNSSSSNNKELAEEEAVLFNEYVSQSGIDTIEEAQAFFESNSVYYIERVEGRGLIAQEGDEVSVRYAVYLLDSTLIYSNETDPGPYVFTLISNFENNGTVPANIAGFHEGLSQMREGGKATFVMPSSKALGTEDYDETYTLTDYSTYTKMSIPKYSPLRFEVELTDVARTVRD